MWKGENYGLALISEINVKREESPKMDLILKT
jgi:hypothetical protein